MRITRLWEPALVCVAVAFVHLTLINQFGATWDEPLHRNWGQLFTMYWQTGDFSLVEKMPGYGMYYGPLYHVLNYLLSDFLFTNEVLRFVPANHVLTVLTFSLCCMLLFVVARRMFSRTVAWVSVLLFVLLPHLVAHAHYNPKDIPVMMAGVLTMLGGWQLLTQRTLLAAAGAGAAFGVALAIKLSAVMMLPALGVALLYSILCSRERRSLLSLRWDAGLLGVFVLCSFVSMYVLWPTLWHDIGVVPAGLATFTRDYWPGQVLYMGTQYSGSALPWHYTLVSLLISVPLPMLLFFGIGVVAAIISIRRKQHATAYVLLLAWILLPILLSMKPGLVRYDGFRQFYFTLPAFAILAARGLWVCGGFKGRGVVALSALTALWVLVEIVQVHPYEGSYMNQLLRLFVRSDIERTMELEYWGPSYKEGVRWLIENAEPNPVICVPTAGVLVTWYPWRQDFRMDCSEESTYVMYIARYTFTKEHELADKEPIFEVRRYNSRLMAIFKVK